MIKCKHANTKSWSVPTYSFVIITDYTILGIISVEMK